MFIHVPTAPGALRRTTAITRPPVTHQQTLNVMGEALLFQTNHADLLAAAVEAFARYPNPPPCDQPLVMQLFVDDPHISRTQGQPHPKPVFHAVGHLLYLTVGGDNTVVVDLQRGYVMGFVTPAVAADRAFVRSTFVETAALAMLGLARDFVPVHAACVVKDGVSLLIHGKAGVGKSTLAFACLRHGFRVLAEDVVHIKVGQRELRLWGAPWTFHLLSDSLRFFPEATHYPLHQQINGEWKIKVELDNLFPAATLTNAAPGLVVLLERATGNQPTGYRPLSVEEARAAFEVVWSWEIGWKAEYEVALSHLLTQGAYRLYMNGTPDEAVAVLVELIAEWKSRVQ
jgi:hypothetical protein